MGIGVGFGVGARVGLAVGSLVGFCVGASEGVFVGLGVGWADGLFVGALHSPELLPLQSLRGCHGHPSHCAQELPLKYQPALHM
jgi:hypothetical protein